MSNNGTVKTAISNEFRWNNNAFTGQVVTANGNCSNFVLKPTRWFRAVNGRLRCLSVEPDVIVQTEHVCFGSTNRPLEDDFSATARPRTLHAHLPFLLRPSFVSHSRFLPPGCWGEGANRRRLRQRVCFVSGGPSSPVRSRSAVGFAASHRPRGRRFHDPELYYLPDTYPHIDV